jgi:hypothetical protein
MKNGTHPSQTVLTPIQTVLSHATIEKGDSLYYYKLKTAGEAQGVYKGGRGRSKTLVPWFSKPTA